MSTPATYEFRATNRSLSDVTVCFYIHHDGYPKGAAQYFYAMHDPQSPDNCQDYASQFFRVNKGAEFTKDRDMHINTAYHYIFSHNQTLSVFERQNDNSWLSLYEGNWLDFVNPHQQPSMKLYRFDRDADSPRPYTMTLPALRDLIDEKKEEAHRLLEDDQISEAKKLILDIGYLKGQLKMTEEKIGQ